MADVRHRPRARRSSRLCSNTPTRSELPTIGRALIPLDEQAARLVDTLPAEAGRLRLSEDAAHALTEVSERPAGPARRRCATTWSSSRDRRKQHWVLIAADHAPLARALAARSDLRSLEGPEGTFALAAVERDAHLIVELLEQLELAGIDPRVQGWLARATTWRGTIDVAGEPDEPVFLLLGDPDRPAARAARTCAQRARRRDGSPDARVLASRSSRTCAASQAPLLAAVWPRSRKGVPAPPAVLELSSRPRRSHVRARSRPRRLAARRVRRC